MRLRFPRSCARRSSGSKTMGKGRANRRARAKANGCQDANEGRAMDTRPSALTASKGYFLLLHRLERLVRRLQGAVHVGVGMGDRQVELLVRVVQDPALQQLDPPAQP